MSQYPEHDPYGRSRPALDPAQYPKTQTWDSPPAQSYHPPTPPPIPVQQSYPPYAPPPYTPQPFAPQPYPPQQPYQQQQAGPLKRTEFGWASCIVGGFGLFLSWIPVFGYFILVAQTVLVVVGLIGPHERTRVPAAIGAGLLMLGVALNLVATYYLKDVFS